MKNGKNSKVDNTSTICVITIENILKRHALIHLVMRRHTIKTAAAAAVVGGSDDNLIKIEKRVRREIEFPEWSATNNRIPGYPELVRECAHKLYFCNRVVIEKNMKTQWCDRQYSTKSKGRQQQQQIQHINHCCVCLSNCTFGYSLRGTGHCVDKRTVVINTKRRT